MRFLCQVPSDVKFTRLPTTTALQRCYVQGWKRRSAHTK